MPAAVRFSPRLLSKGPPMKCSSAILTNMSGKLGGAVAAKARGGVQYFRSLVIPRNPNTAAQTTVRGIMASLASYWRSTLTGPQRESWETLAESGSGEVSGEALYVGNGFHQRLGATVTGGDLTDLNTAPASASTPLSPLSAFVADASAHSIAFAINTGDPWNATDVGGLNISVSKPQSASRLSQQFGYTYAGTEDNEATSPVTLVLPTTHPAYSMATGQVVYVKVVAFTIDGRQSVAQEFRVTVTA